MLRHILRTATTREGDLERAADGSLLDDNGLDTVVSNSLFTDAKATDDELARSGLTQRGYWFDAFDDDPALNTGSKLWLLEGAVINADTLARAKAYCDEALAWMVAAKAARQVDVVVDRMGTEHISIEVTVYRPDESSPYVLTWEAHLAA